APPAGGPRASYAAATPKTRKPAQGQGGTRDVLFVAHFVRPRNMKRRKPIACLLSACQRKTCGTRARPNSAAGRRGRRGSAYEAPRAAADRGTPLGGAESKRRRRPRLPAPPSRVTLLVARAVAADRPGTHLERRCVLLASHLVQQHGVVLEQRGDLAVVRP